MAYHVQAAPPGAGQLAFDALSDMRAFNFVGLAPGVTVTLLSDGSRWEWFPTGTTAPAGTTQTVTGGVLWLSDAGAVAASVAVAPFVLDANSIVPGGLDGAEWRMLYPSQAPTIRKLAAVDAAGYMTLVEVNLEGTAPPNARLARPFTLPPTCTGVTVSLPVKQAGNANVVVLRVTDTLGQTVEGTTTITPTGALVTTTLTVAGLTAGVEYQVQVLVNTAGQSDFYAGRIAVTPTGGSGFWAGTWTRLDATGAILDTNESGWAAVRYPTQSTFSHVDFLTNAASFIVESFNNVGENLAQPYDSETVLVDGLMFATFDPAVDVVSYNAVALPGGTHRVSVACGPQYFQGQSADEAPATAAGTFTCAIYLPTPSTVAPLPAQTHRDVWVAYGDSKLCYFGAPTTQGGPFGALRSQGIDVVCEAYGGREAEYDVGQGATVAACAPFAAKLCQCDPDVIVINIGRNDYFGNGLTLAAWTTLLGNLVTAVHAICPLAQVRLATWSRETSEPNNLSASMDAYRLAMTTVAAANQAFCIVVAWDQAWTVATAGTYTTDGIHVNDRGQALLSQITLGNQPAIPGVLGAPARSGEPWPWTPLALGASLVGWYDPTQVSNLVVGAAMSAVTAVGAGPTVTLSGAPSFPFNLLIAFSAAGVRGVATFKWSIDGGLSWIQKGVVTAASVVLPGTGVTVAFGAGSYTTAMTYAAGTQISQMTDLSGTGNHMVQAVSANQPYLKLQGLTGKNPVGMLMYNGTTDFLERAGIGLPNAFTVAAIGKMSSGATDRTMLGSDSRGVIMDITGSGGAARLYAGGVVGAAYAGNVLTTYVGVYGASGLLRINGATVSSGNPGSAVITNAYLGQGGTGLYFWDNVLGETLLLNVAATPAQYEAIEAYYADKYNTGIAPL